MPELKAFITRVHDHPGYLGARLLVIGGVSLVCAGAVLWFQGGAFVYFENAVLQALSWCF
jgi:hypothetical protein